MNTTDSKVWFHRETVTFFAIPKSERFEAGAYLLERFDGVQKNVQHSQIEDFAISADEAKVLLRAAYDKVMEQAQKHFSALTGFMDLTGADPQKALQELAPELADNPGTEFMQHFFQQLNTPGTSEEEQKQSFKDTFAKIPEMLSFFDKEQLDKAAEDPEQWAQAMQEKMYGKERAATAKKRGEALKNDIAEQLRKNIAAAEKKHR